MFLPLKMQLRCNLVKPFRLFLYFLVIKQLIVIVFFEKQIHKFIIFQ